MSQAATGRRVSRLVGRTCAVAVAIAIASGCAARRPSSPAARFIKPGEPAVSLDVPEIRPPHQWLRDYAARLRELQARARPKSSVLPTIESTDPALASALLALRAAETAENHRRVADAYRKAGVTDHAHKHLQRAVRLNRCYSEAYEDLARLWRDWGFPEQALRDARRAVVCGPRSPSAHNTLGTVLMMLDQRRGARHAFETALRLDDRAAYALNNLCYAALHDGDGAAAQRACERTLELDPMLVAAQRNLALAYALQGDVRRAEVRLLDGADAATGQYNVGVLRMALGEYGGAAAAFEAALLTKPSLAHAAKRAAQARALAAAQQD